MEENAKKGLGIAAVVLGGLSILCCSCFGLGVIMSIIGGIFSIVCLVKGTGTGKTLGIIGIVLNAIGLLMGLYILIMIIATIDWSNVTIQNLQEINNIDTNDQHAVQQWMQQFFKVDVSSSIN